MTQSSQHQSIDTDTMLDVYILDYLTRRKLNASSRVFGDEAKVPLNRPAIDSPRGFLLEWWTIFWDIFVSRYKHHQGFREPFHEEFRVPQHQQQINHDKNLNVNASNIVNWKSTMVSEASTTTRQAVSKQWQRDDVGILMSHIKSISHQPSAHQKQALDANSMMSFLMNRSAQGFEGLTNGAHAATGVLNSPPLKGWPLMVPDQIQTRIYQGQTEGQSQPPNDRKRSQSDSQLHPLIDTKRKQPLMSSSVANTLGTANVIGGSSNLAEASLPHSPLNDKINIDDFLNYGALDGTDNSLISRTDKEADVGITNAFTFSEMGSIQTTSVNCCDISFDGKLVATAGQDKKARLWSTNSFETKATFDGHSEAITDIRFSPSMQCLATSSHDKTIKVWDLENPSCSSKTFKGHTTSVMSVDFHPKKEDFLCSCDETEIRYWTIKNVGCSQVSKGGANIVRFQSSVGKLLASAVGKSVSLIDLDKPQGRRHNLKGHGSTVQSLSWDSSGEHLISVSEDLIKVWRMDVGGKANCIHELSVPGKRFHCGIFHPSAPPLLVIGCYQSMVLWNMTENRMMTTVEEPVTAVVASSSGLIASAGHNGNVVKLWK